MKLQDYFDLHNKLKNNLGDDLVYSLAFDNGNYVLAVSTHKSETQQFSHGRKIQSCIFAPVDLDADVDSIIATLTDLYKEILEAKKAEEVDDVVG
jgi:hypothetical protein